MRISRPRAFTIIELLVVIGIIVLLIAIAVPAFSSMLQSTERSLAENQLKAAIAAGRDAAIKSEAGDAATVFFFTPGGRVTAVPCVAVAQIEDFSRHNTTSPTAFPLVTRDIFVPVAGSTPIQMPRGWSVRGFAAPGTTYTGAAATNNDVDQFEPWYESYFGGTLGPNVAAGCWVFPETGFIDARAAAVNNNTTPSGTRRQTFMVRFKAGSGDLDLSTTSTALIFDPVAGDPATVTTFRTAAPFSNFRADQLRVLTSVAPSPAAFVKRVINHPSVTPQQRRQLLGDRSPDTVLARPVTELALYEEARLATGIRARGLNRATGTLYGDLMMPRYDTALLPADISNQAQLATAIRRWIEGRPGTTPPEVREPFDARVYTLQRYMGQLAEVEP
jgi:prepilin-type N-terminal cleavage/methylation domain-containing protein